MKQNSVESLEGFLERSHLESVFGIDLFQLRDLLSLQIGVLFERRRHLDLLASQRCNSLFVLLDCAVQILNRRLFRLQFRLKNVDFAGGIFAPCPSQQSKPTALLTTYSAALPAQITAAVSWPLVPRRKFTLQLFRFFYSSLETDGRMNLMLTSNVPPRRLPIL